MLMMFAVLLGKGGAAGDGDGRFWGLGREGMRCII